MNPLDLIARYIDCWNEPDPVERTQQLRDLLIGDATYEDPHMTGRGVQEIADMVGQARQQFNGLVFHLDEASIQIHHSYARFSWTLGSLGDPPVIGGTDVAFLQADKIKRIVGFIDFAPTVNPS